MDKQKFDELTEINSEDAMKFNELLIKIDEIEPNLLGNPASKKNAKSLLRYAFNIINKEVEKIDEGDLIFSGLGKFKVKTVDRKNKDGEVVARKVVRFIPVKKKDKGLKADKIAGSTTL